jgi:hypothetical protein
MKYIFDVCGSFVMFTNGHLVKYLVIGRMLKSVHEFFNLKIFNNLFFLPLLLGVKGAI